MTHIRRRYLLVTLAALALLATVALSVDPVRSYAMFLLGKVRGGYTVEERLTAFNAIVAERIGPAFVNAGLRYPPRDVAFLAFKDKRILEVYGRMTDSGEWRFVAEYPVLGTSGRLGPKLAEGDKQVPEGIYRVAVLNPNSRFHLSIGLDYPNDFDRRMAAADGRKNLGGDIMIHGSSVSIGCLAMGDQAAEDLFVTAARVGREHVRVLIAPTDFRMSSLPATSSDLPWVDSLYLILHKELRQFRREPR